MSSTASDEATTYLPASGGREASSTASDEATTYLPTSGEPTTALPASGEATTAFSAAGAPPAQFSAGGPGWSPAAGATVPPSAVGGGQPGGKSRKSSRTLLLSVLGVVLVVVIGGAVMLAFGGGGGKDEAEKAKVGDCVAASGKVSDREGDTSQTAAKVVNCSARDAAYKVLGRVNGQTNANSKACDQYFTDAKASYFVYASTSGKGYLLCLQSTKG